MITKEILYSVGSRVVLAFNQDADQVWGLAPIEVNEDNAGVVLKAVRLSRDEFEYSVILDNGEVVDFQTKPLGLGTKIESIEDTLQFNQEKLESYLEWIEIVKSNLEYLNKVEFNDEETINENVSKTKEFVKEEIESENKYWYSKGSKLREEILSCKTKNEAEALVTRKRFTVDSLVHIADSLGIKVNSWGIKAVIIEELVNGIFDKK